MTAENLGVSNLNLNYERLDHLATEPGRGKSTIGVIIDATGMYISNNSLDFVTRVRIID